MDLVLLGWNWKFSINTWCWVFFFFNSLVLRWMDGWKKRKETHVLFCSS